MHKEWGSRFVLAGLATLVSVLLFPARAGFGVCFQPNPTLRCKFLNSDAVFVGTVLSTRVEPPGLKPDPSAPLAFNGIQGWVYTLSVQKMFRGPQVEKISVITTNDESRVFLADGVSYLVFAHRTSVEDLNSELGYEFWIDNCDNPTLASQAKQAIRELQAMKMPENAEIEGQVCVLATSAPLPGLGVMIRGDDRSFQTSTDRNGWFHLEVPPGTYSAVVQQNRRWKIAPFGASHDDPEHFEALRGRCSGLQFMASPR